jgi:hypothetical protein
MISSLGLVGSTLMTPVTPHGVFGEVVEDTIGRTVLAGVPLAGIAV